MRTVGTKLTMMFISLVIISLIFSSLSRAVVDPETAVGIWLFDEGDGNDVKDTSGKDNHGAIVGDPEWVQGRIGKGLDLDGVDDHVEVPDSDTLDLDEALSIVTWFKFGKADVENINRFVSKYGAGGNYLLQFYSTGGEPYTVQFGMWHDPTGWDIQARVVVPNWKLDDNVIAEWHHFAGTWDGKVIKVYVDGEEIGSKDYPGPVQTSDDPVYLGRGGTGYSFGIIDEIGLFNAALTVGDVKQIMENGLEKVVTAVDASGKLTTTWGSIKLGIKHNA